MTLTPEQLTSMRARLGVETPTQAPVQNRASELDSAWGTPVSKPNPIVSAIKGETSFPADENATTALPNIARTAGNIPSSAAKLVRGVIAPVNPLDTENPVNIGANVSKGASALHDIYKEKGVVQGTKDILGGFADTYLKIGETIYGGIDKAYNALLDNPKEAILKATEHIAKIGIEDPLFIPSLLYGGAKGTGAKTDILTRVSGVDTSVSNIANKVGTKLEESGQKTIDATRQEFARELTRPERTPSVKKAEVGRTTETGVGPFKKSIVEPTPLEARSTEEVAKIKEINPKNTYQQNYNAIKSENTIESAQLVADLKNNDFVYPKKELKARLNSIVEDFSNNPVLVGDSETSARRLATQLNKLIDEAPAKGSSLLQVRKDFDTLVENFKGNKIFDPKTENAFSSVLREFRQTINNFLEEKAPTVGVKQSLQKQSALYHAMDNVEVKAANEADTAIGRVMQRASKVLGTKNKVVQAVAALVGIGGLGAAATFAPAIAASTIPIYLTYRAGKFLLKPELRVALGKVLKEVGSSIDMKDKVIIENLVNEKE